MSDLINRHDAIDAARKCPVKEVTPAYMLIDKSEIMTELMLIPSAEQERKKGKWTTEEVAEILFDAFGDDCACNFNGIDEWLPERCKYTQITDECPNPKEKHGCWMQFLLQG